MPSATTARIRWQKPMVRVLWAAAPIAASAVYFFGWRVLVMLALINAVAFACEAAFTRRWNEPVSAAVFVTGTLYVFALPPTLPYWMAAVGIVFGIVFGKMVFGGFGKNVFNPALSGRAFVYISFGGHMTARWVEPVAGVWGGLTRYAADAVTSATPGMAMKGGELTPLSRLLLGNTAGVIGGTSAILVLIGGLWIVWNRTANYRIVVAGVAGYLTTQALLWAFGPAGTVPPLHALLAGSGLIALFFYATDPVSASQTNPGRWIYGAAIGIMASVITVFSAWPGGAMFAILLANMFAPIMDIGIRRRGAQRAAKTAGR